MNINGVLSIRTIQGRNGPFNVGRLITDLGEFAVKDTLLDQYDEGRYEGNFSVMQIFPASYLAGGRFVVEVRATLKNLTLDGIDELKPEDTAVVPEPDPIGDQVQPVAAAPESSDQVPVQSEPEVEGDGDETLFGALWQLGQYRLYSTKPSRSCKRLAVVVEGGNVQAVIADHPDAAPSVAVIDYDTDSFGSQELSYITQSDGSQSTAVVSHYYVEDTVLSSAPF